MANTFLNYISEKFIHEHHTQTKGGRERTFYSVSIPCSESVSGYGTFSVNTRQVYNSRTEGYKNILLGEGDKTQKVSIFNGQGYETIALTNEEIVREVKNQRQRTVSATAVATA